MAEEQDDAAKVEEFLQTRIKSEVETYFNELNSKQQSVQQQQQTPSEQELARQQLKEIISPIFDSDIKQSRFDAADAKDYTRFYQQNPSADQDEIESTFKALVDAGRPTSRADIARYLVGKKFEADPTKFMSEMSERQKQQLERAGSAGDVGVNALDKAKNDPTWTNFSSLSVEDMEKALDGVTF